MYNAITRRSKKSGKLHADLMKDQKCRDYQETLKLQLEELPTWMIKATDVCKVLGVMILDKEGWFSTSNDKIRRIDTTNLWKPTEDSLFTFFEIDDSTACDSRLIKAVREEGELKRGDDEFELYIFIDLYSFKKTFDKVISKYGLREYSSEAVYT